ncbi:terminase small subunit [Macrococcus armenti]|uniref:terminase small subunit n=1 Tax=Macrococcus armenti TaxID=2875764 RepID=UPI001CCE1E90|nr:terminase small subunit [Macrococcus armenti]UBH16391.1 terminase small subunit [Macrococcus armenti]UBH18747.1 terminase small subunit [Macrococcus armenti]UBH21019.1 terminase small subunit [Macrococcus armenti]
MKEDIKTLRDELNVRQQKFAEAYAKTGNATRSAIEAGYKQSRAEVTGSELVRNSKVSAYIEGLRDEMMDDAILTGKEVLYYLSRVATGVEMEEAVFVTKKAEYITNPNTDRKQLVYNEHSEIIQYPPKTSDRNKALELLGKHHKLFTDKNEVEVTTPTLINDIPMED